MLAGVDYDPYAHWEAPPAPLARPKFFPIVASNSLATIGGFLRGRTSYIAADVVEYLQSSAQCPLPATCCYCA